jgi:F-type H+-transporting ATPase subunit delta
VNTKTIARRYAQALLQIAQEKQAIDSYEKELDDCLATINSDEHLQHIWYSERILTEDKKKVFKELFGGNLSDMVVNLLMLLIDKNREAFLPDIFTEYKKQADVTRNIIDAEVRSAVALTDKDFNILAEKLSAMSGKNVRLHSVVDPSIIGGIVVKMGDKVIDGSVIKRLSIMKKNLSNIQFSRLG